MKVVKSAILGVVTGLLVIGAIKMCRASDLGDKQAMGGAIFISVKMLCNYKVEDRLYLIFVQRYMKETGVQNAETVNNLMAELSTDLSAKVINNGTVATFCKSAWPYYSKDAVRGVLTGN